VLTDKGHQKEEAGDFRVPNAGTLQTTEHQPYLGAKDLSWNHHIKTITQAAHRTTISRGETSANAHEKPNKLESQKFMVRPKLEDASSAPDQHQQNHIQKTENCKICVNQI
jgi:hypothetical protein